MLNQQTISSITYQDQLEGSQLHNLALPSSTIDKTDIDDIAGSFDKNFQEKRKPDLRTNRPLRSTSSVHQQTHPRSYQFEQALCAASGVVRVRVMGVRRSPTNYPFQTLTPFYKHETCALVRTPTH